MAGNRTNEIEEAAARNVQRVLGGTWELHDTGEEPGMYDIRHELDNGATVALEVTSEGEPETIEARLAINKRTAAGMFAGDSLDHQWLVGIDTSTRVSTLQPGIETALRDFETRGLEAVSSRGAHPRFGDRDAWTLAALGVSDVTKWNPDFEPDEPRIIVTTSFSVIGEHTSLPEAIERVFAQTHNQDKLAKAEVDERHLFVHMRDKAAASGLRGIWPLPTCPPDPRGLIDVLWIYGPWASSQFLHRVAPGTDEWSHFMVATGEPVPEEALSAS